MYYLSVVANVIQYKENNKFLDHNNYLQLNEEEKEAVYKLALLMEPKIFIEAGIFLVEPSLVPQGRLNDFLKITDERIGVHVNQEIMIGGRSVKVLHIMVCKNDWLNKYYNIPISNITNRRNRRNQNMISMRTNQVLRTEDRMIRTVPYSNNAIIINQVAPRYVSPQAFGTNPVTLVCPVCKNLIATRITSEFNCASCCLCCWNWIIWLIVQLARDKELNCTDATHRCPNCKNIIGKYDAC